MSSIINSSEVDKEEIKSSKEPYFNFNHIRIKKLAKTPEMIYATNSNFKSNFNSQKLQNSNYNLDHSTNIQSLNMSKEELHINMHHSNLFKKNLINLNKHEQIIKQLIYLNKKMKENNKKIENFTDKLKNLKEEKNQKKSDIVNLLSNKESLEEIYKNKIYYSIKNKNINQNNYNNNNFNINGYEDENKTNKFIDSEAFKIDQEKELEIKIDEIKKSDKIKFLEQVINLTEEIFQKSDEEFNKKLKDKVDIIYKIFNSQITSSTIYSDNFIISNFFSRISLFISNHSLGNYSEMNINKFLRYLIKINSIGSDISQIIKFLNKKYKELKKEFKEQINELNKKNGNLIEKKIILEKRKKELEILMKKKKEYSQNTTIIRGNFELEKSKEINNSKKLDVHYSSNTVINKISPSNEIIIKKRKIYNTDKGNNNELSMENNNNKKNNESNKKIHRTNINERNIYNKYTNLVCYGTRRKYAKININNNNKDSENEKNMIQNEKNSEIKDNKEIISFITNNDSDKEGLLNKNLKNELNKNKRLNIPKLLKIRNRNLTKNYISSEDKKIKINRIISQINSDSMKNIRAKYIKLNKSSKNGNKIKAINVNNLVINNDIDINPIKTNIKEKNIDNNKEKDSQNNEIYTKIYYSRKNANNIKIKKNNTIGVINKIFKKNNKNKYLKNNEDNKDNKDNNLIGNGNIISYKNSIPANYLPEENSNIIYNRNNYNIPNNQYNKNIYIINNINNSEQINTKNNIHNRTKDINKINSIMNNKKSEINSDINNKTINNTNNIQQNIGKNYFEVFNISKNDNNELLDDISSISKSISQQKLKFPKSIANISNSSYNNIKSNKKKVFVVQKNNLVSKNIINNFERNNLNNVQKMKKKLTERNLLNIYSRTNTNKDFLISNNKIKINNKEYRIIKSRKKVSIPISSNIINNNRNNYIINKDEKLNKTELSTNTQNSNLFSE